MPGVRWSPQEDDWARTATSYDAYCAMAGEQARTKAEVQNRRQRLKAQGFGVSDWIPGVTPTYARNETAVAVEEPPEVEDEPFGFRDRHEDEDVRDYWEGMKRAIAAHQRRMEKHSHRTIEHTTEEPDKPFGLFFFGDTHLGSGGILGQRIEDDFELMRQACTEHGARLVFMGDAIENAKKDGKASPAVYEQAIPPVNQIDVAELLFSPLAPYFLAFLEGNHDSRDSSMSGIGWMQSFAKRIGVPYVSEAGCSIHLTHGFHRAVIYAKHDWRGKSVINRANSLRRFSQEYPEWEGGDVCVLAHLHEPLYESTQQKGRRVHWIRTGSWKVYDHYAEKGGYTPEVGVAVVIFWPHERRISVSLDLEEGIAMLADARRRSTEAA